jgi:hypothetical protein
MFGHLSQLRDRSHNDSDEDNLESLDAGHPSLVLYL